MGSQKGNVKKRRKVCRPQLIEKTGSSGWIRTSNPPVNRRKKKRSPPLAAVCWTLPDRASSLAESHDFELRFVPLLAAVCCSLLHPKGKKRATFRAECPFEMRNRRPQLWVFSVDPAMEHYGHVAHERNLARVCRRFGFSPESFSK
jgi:hypothetical protein